MIFNKKNEQPKINTKKDKLISLFNTLDFENKEKYAYLALFSNLLTKLIINEFIPIIENDHKKKLTSIQKQIIFYFIGINIVINNTKEIHKLPKKTNMKYEKLYKRYVTNIIMNIINKSNKIENLFNIDVDYNISIAFIQLLVMLYYFEKKEYNGSLFINYKKSYNYYIFIVEDCFEKLNGMLSKLTNYTENFIKSINTAPEVLLDTFFEQIIQLKEQI